MTVRHDGGWYVSPAYTALEYAREADGGPAADFGSAQGAPSSVPTRPSTRSSDALHAWQAGNWDRLMALAPPDELPVYDYRAWIDKEAADTHPDFTIDKLDTTATVNGDTAIVKLDASGTTGSGSDQGKWQVGGTCPTQSFDNSSGSSLVPDGTASTGSESVTQIGENGGGAYSSSSGASGVFEPVVFRELCLSGDLGRRCRSGSSPSIRVIPRSPSGAISIEVVRGGGRWFVSPVTTVLDAVDSTIQHVDQRTVYTLLGLAYQLPPDGAITLDQPFKVPSEHGLLQQLGVHLRRHEGPEGRRREQRQATPTRRARSTRPTGRTSTTSTSDAEGSGSDMPTTLPETGSYRLVMNGFRLPTGGTLTLWDAKDAPKGLIGQNDGISSDGSGGDVHLHAQERDVQFDVPSDPVVARRERASSTCTIKNNELVCPGNSGSNSVTATTSPGPRRPWEGATSVP